MRFSFSKGKGEMFTYFLIGEDPSSRQQRLSVGHSCADDHATNVANHVTYEMSTKGKTKSHDLCPAEIKETINNQITTIDHLSTNGSDPRGIMKFIFPNSVRSTVTSCTSNDCHGYRRSLLASECPGLKFNSLQDCSVHDHRNDREPVGLGQGQTIKDFRIPKIRHGRALLPESGSDSEIGGSGLSSLTSDDEWYHMAAGALTNNAAKAHTGRLCRRDRRFTGSKRRRGDSMLIEYSLSESVV
jgi:hypothetical protein